MSFIVEPIAGWTSKTSMNLRGLIVRNHIERYRISSTTKVAPFTAQAALNLQPFGIYAPDPTSRLRDCDTDMVEGKRHPWVYESTVHYSSETPDPSQDNRQEDNPLDDKPEIDLDGEIILYPMFKDRDNKLIANKANQTILGVDEERSIEVLTIVRNEPTRNSSRDRAFRNTVNQNAWADADPGQLKIRSIKSTRQYRNEILFWRYTYVIAFNDKGWQPKVLNDGLMQLDNSGDSPRLVPCRDSNNEPVSERVPLDNDGKQLGLDSLPTGAIYLTFNTLAQMPFENLGLPSR